MGTCKEWQNPSLSSGLCPYLAGGGQAGQWSRIHRSLAGGACLRLQLTLLPQAPALSQLAVVQLGRTAGGRCLQF